MNPYIRDQEYSIQTTTTVDFPQRRVGRRLRRYHGSAFQRRVERHGLLKTICILVEPYAHMGLDFPGLFTLLGGRDCGGRHARYAPEDAGAASRIWSPSDRFRSLEWKASCR